MSNNDPFRFPIGSLVVLKSFPIESLKENRSKIEFNVDQHDTPIMVVHEMAHNPHMEKLFEVHSGSQIASKSKYRCSWFSKKQGSFNDSWFYEDQLKKIAAPQILAEDSFSKIGDAVTYITSSLEKNKWIKPPQNEIVTTDLNKPILKKLNNFIPPSLCVKSIQFEENPIVYDQKKGVIVSKKPSCLVKCVWYNMVSNKFSEVFLPRETLIYEKINSDENS